MKDKIVKELRLKQTIDTVWSAITEQEELSTWFMPCDFKAEVGYRYEFTSPDPHCRPIIGEVLEATPYRLVYTWVEKGVDIITTVCWQLEEEGSVTLLELTHSGIADYPAETATKMFDSFSGGWGHCFKSLQEHIAERVHEG